MVSINTIEALEKWRTEDHEDFIVLSRSSVCYVLDEIKELKKNRNELSWVVGNRRMES